MTQASPVQHGQQAMNDRICHAEQVIELTGFSNQIGYQGSFTWTVATVTMPWDGQLTAHVVTEGSYPAGVMGVTLWLDGSSPAPAGMYAGTMRHFQDVGTAYEFVASIAQWRDLAKGQVVTVSARVYVDVANVNWTVMSFIGWLRMARI